MNSSSSVDASPRVEPYRGYAPRRLTDVFVPAGEESAHRVSPAFRADFQTTVSLLELELARVPPPIAGRHWLSDLLAGVELRTGRRDWVFQSCQTDAAISRRQSERAAAAYGFGGAPRGYAGLGGQGKNDHRRTPVSAGGAQR